MSLRGKVELKTVELPDAIEFTVSREESVVEQVVFPALALFVLVWFWSIGSLYPRILAVFAGVASAAAWIANRMQGGETTLRVTYDGLVADGNLGHLFSTHEGVGVGELSSIRYLVGGDGEVSGLSARLDWRTVMLLPHISADQANLIIDKIRHKFPGIPAEPYAPFSMSDLSIFDRGSDITTLGLSDTKGDSDNC